MGQDYNWRRESHMPPTVTVPEPPAITRLQRLKGHKDAPAPSQESINALVDELFPTPAEDARCIYSVGVIISSESTRRVVRPGEPDLGGAAGADFARLQTAFESISSDRVSCTPATWMCDNGCVYDRGSWGLAPFIQLASDQPLLSEDRDTGLMRPIPLYGFEHPQSDSELYRQALDYTGLLNKLNVLLNACMAGGGTFDIAANRIQPYRDRSTSEQLALLDTLQYRA